MAGIGLGLTLPSQEAEGKNSTTCYQPHFLKLY
jgi:hypothetical protein